MGKVEKFVKKREAEKHTTLEQFLDTMSWYIKEMHKLDVECSKAKADLTEAYNAKLKELAK